MARPLKIAWRHTEEELYDLYIPEKEADLARRWQALWLLIPFGTIYALFRVAIHHRRP